MNSGVAMAAPQHLKLPLVVASWGLSAEHQICTIERECDLFLSLK